MAKKGIRINRKNGARPTISRVDLLMAVFECGLHLEKGWFNYKKFLRAKACRYLSPAERKELRTRVLDRFIAYHEQQHADRKA